MSKLNQSANEYTTLNISLASFLKYAGIPHVATVKVSPTKVRFKFYDPENAIPHLGYEFFSGCAAVSDAMELFETERELKQTIAVAHKTGRWDAPAEGSEG